MAIANPPERAMNNGTLTRRCNNLKREREKERAKQEENKAWNNEIK